MMVVHDVHINSSSQSGDTLGGSSVSVAVFALSGLIHSVVHPLSSSTMHATCN